MTQVRPLAQAVACAVASPRSWGMSTHLPSPVKRQPLRWQGVGFVRGCLCLCVRVAWCVLCCAQLGDVDALALGREAPAAAGLCVFVFICGNCGPGCARRRRGRYSGGPVAAQSQCEDTARPLPMC